MEDLLTVAKELLQDFDMYGPPVRLDVIAKLRRAVEAAQQSAQDAACAHEYIIVLPSGKRVCGTCNAKLPRR